MRTFSLSTTDLYSVNFLNIEKKSVLNGKTPIWKYWDEFVKHYRREGKSSVTILNVRDALRFAVIRLNIMTIEDCNTPNVLREALYSEREKRHWSPVTLNTYIKNLNTYFRWLEDMEYVQENKIMKVRKCKEIMHEQLTLKEEQVDLIRICILKRRQTRLERARNQFLFDVFLLTAARPCELEQMQIRDIKKNKNGYEIVIQGRKQKGRARFYRMPSSLRDMYDGYIRIRQSLGREESCLFSSQSRRSGFRYKGINGLFKKLSKELGFRITAYSIRRFVATKLYTAGVPLKDIQQHLGHTRLTTTLRYIEHTCALTNRGTDEMAKLLG
jgi:integrase